MCIRVDQIPNDLVIKLCHVAFKNLLLVLTDGILACKSMHTSMDADFMLVCYRKIVYMLKLS